MKWIAAGVEVSKDRQRTWLALAGVEDGYVVVRLEDSVPGALVVQGFSAMWSKHPLDAIGIDPHSPSATLVESLVEEGLPLKQADAIGIAVAHGRFRDLLSAGRLKLQGNKALNEAARKASERKLAGSVALDRYSGPDVSPLNAAELAVWALGDPDRPDGLGPDDVYVGKF